VAGLVLLPVAALAVLPVLVDANQYRSILLSQLQQALNRPVRLGDMKLRSFPLGIRIQDFAIGDDARLNSQVPFASAKQVRVDISVWALLRNQIQITSVRLEQPAVQLIRLSGGTWNFATLGPPQGGGGQNVRIAALHIDDGKITLVGESGERSVYDHIDLDVRGYAPGQRFAAELSARLPGQGGALAWKGQAVDAANFEGRWQVKNASVRSLQQFLSRDAAEVEGIVTGEWKTVAEGGRYRATGELTLRDAVVRKRKLDFPVALTLNGGFDRSTEVLQLQEAVVKLGGTTLKIQGTVDTKADPARLALQVQTQESSLAEWARLAHALGAAESNIETKGRVTADVRVEGTLKQPALQGQVSLSALSAKAPAWKQPVEVAQMRLDFTPVTLQTQPFTVQAGSTKLEGQLRLDDYAGASPRIDAEFRTHQSNLANLLQVAETFGLAGGESVTGTGQVSVQVRARGAAKAPSLSGSGSLEGATLQTPALKQPLTIARADIRFQEDAVVLENLQASLGGSTFRGRFSARHFAAPQVNFALDIDQWNVQQMQAALNPPAGQPGSRPSLLAKTSGTGQVSIGNLVANDLTLTNVKAACELNQGQLQLSPITASLFGGQLAGAMTGDSKPAVPAFGLNAKLEQVEANRLLGSALSSKVLFGKLSAESNVRFSGFPGPDLVRSLNGTVNFRLTEGKLQGVNLLNEFAKIAKFLGYSASEGAMTDIVRMSGTMQIADGVAQTEDLRVELAGAELGGRGQINLTDQTLNLRLTALFTKDFSQRVGGSQIGGLMVTTLANERGELLLPAVVSGPLAQPRVAPDAETFARMKLQSLQKGNLSETLKGTQQKVGEIIDLFRKKPPPKQ
jgi:uncharacterized protein involved in outer membrane biogenesis